MSKHHGVWARALVAAGSVTACVVGAGVVTLTPTSETTTVVASPTRITQQPAPVAVPQEVAAVVAPSQPVMPGHRLVARPVRDKPAPASTKPDRRSTKSQRQREAPVVAEPAPRPVVVRMAHANIYTGLAEAAFTSDLSQVTARRPDFVTLNETPWRTYDQITPEGYESYRGMDSPFTRETPVLWRTDRWEKVSTGTRYLSTRQVKWGIRAVNWVTVRHRDTGRVLSVVSAHPAPTITVTRGLLPIYMTRLAALTNELSAHGPVLVGGDLNMGYQGPLYTPGALAAGNLTPTYATLGRPPGGTGDKFGATIDYILYTPGAGLTARRQGTVELLSDHDLVWANFRMDPTP